MLYTNPFLTSYGSHKHESQKNMYDIVCVYVQAQEKHLNDKW